MNFINETAYNYLILAQEDMVYFNIIEEAMTKANKYGDARKGWMKLSIIFYPTTGDFKRIIHKKFSKCGLYDVIISPKEWIAELGLLREDLQNLDVHIDNSEITTHIISNLTEEYQNIVEIIYGDLDDEDNQLTIEMIRDKLSVNYDQMNKNPRPKISRENEKSLSIKFQYKSTCKTCGKYRQNSKDCCNR